MRALLLIALSATACRPRSEVLIGLATELAGSEVDTVRVWVQQKDFPEEMGCVPNYQYNIDRKLSFADLPGSFAIYDDSYGPLGDSGPRFLFCMEAYRGKIPVARRYSVMSLPPGETRFYRLGLTQNCTLPGQVSSTGSNFFDLCPHGSQCVEGECRSAAVDSGALPAFESAMERSTSCDSGSAFIVPSTGAPMAASRSSCPAGETCFEGTCYRAPPHADSGVRVLGHGWKTADVFYRAVAANATHIYLACGLEGAAVARMPRDGGALEPVAMGECPAYISLDANNVYWLDSKGLEAAPLAGGAARLLLAGQAHPTVLAVDDLGVYASTISGLVRVPAAGGTPQTLDATYSGTTLASDGNRLYWLDSCLDFAGGSGRVLSLDHNGGAVTELASGAAARCSFSSEIAVSGGFVYWTRAKVSDGPLNGQVVRVSAQGGQPMLVADAINPTGPLVSDGKFVYFTDNYTRVLQAAVDGQTAPVSLFEPAGDPSSLFVDGSTLLIQGNLAGKEYNRGVLWRVPTHAP